MVIKVEEFNQAGLRLIQIKSERWIKPPLTNEHDFICSGHYINPME